MHFDSYENIKRYRANMPVPDTIRIDPSEYDWYVKRMNRKGVTIPQFKEFKRDRFDTTELRMLQEVFAYSFIWSNKYVIEVKLKPGMISDLASSPKAFRWFVDNDSLIVLVAAYCFHDPAFGLHLFDFDTSNAIFRDLIKFHVEKIYRHKLMKLSQGDKKYKKKLREINKFRKSGMRKANLYHFGVSTPIGKNIYKNSDFANHWNIPFVEFSCKEL